MSLNRLLLRTAAVAALLPQADDEYPITMAGNRIYDTRLDPLSHSELTKDGETLPVVVIYTEDDEAELINVSSGAQGIRKRNVSLRVEIVLGTFAMMTMDGASERVYALPTLDAELEAQLDVFEQQVMWALLHMAWRPGTSCFLRLARSIHSIRSVPTRDESGSNKVASRSLTMGVEVGDDCPPSIGIIGEEETPGPLTFEDHPGAPWLADMFRVLAASQKRHPVFDILGNARTAAIYLPLLNRIGTTTSYSIITT